VPSGVPRCTAATTTPTTASAMSASAWFLSHSSETLSAMFVSKKKEWSERGARDAALRERNEGWRIEDGG
jgi:hypothetical protein